MVYSDNWDKERQDIIDDTLSTIRDQEDDKQKQDFVGEYKINPQAFTNSAKNLIAGPISFESPFQSAPNILFGQKPVFKNDQTLLGSSVASAIEPFLIMPYIYRFNFTGGTVDGFYMGMYAITSVPSDVYEHTVYWRATGDASRYRDQRTEESWSESYDYNDSSFLTEDATQGEYDD